MGNIISGRKSEEVMPNVEIIQAAATGDLVELARLIDEDPARVNAGDYDSRTPIHLACAEGHLKAVKMLIANGAHATVQDRWAHEPLQEAILYGHLAVANYLLDSGVRLSDQCKESFESSICSLAAQGDLFRIQLLLQAGLSVNYSDFDRSTPLHCAAGAGQEQMVRLLLSSNADVNATDRFGDTPMAAAAHGHHDGVQAILHTAGASPAADASSTPMEITQPRRFLLTRQKTASLMSDARLHPRTLGRSKSLQPTRTSSASHGASSSSMVASIIDAAAKGDTRDLARALARGASVDSADYDRRTSLHLACSEGRIDAVKYLLKRRAPLDAVDRWGHVPLLDAIVNGHRDVVATLTRAGASLTVKGHLELSGKVCALAAQGDARRLANLIDCGVSPNAVDRAGRTPLILAAAAGHAGIVRYLLCAGADPRRRGPDGGTALAAAIAGGHAAAAALLEPTAETSAAAAAAAVAAAAHPHDAAVAECHVSNNPRDRLAFDALIRALRCAADAADATAAGGEETSGAGPAGPDPDLNPGAGPGPESGPAARHGRRRATVLFVDVAGFSGSVRREEISEALACLFGRMGALAAAHGVLPLGVFGDAYMVAANVTEMQV